MTFTPNKGYNDQITGTNSGTWGIILNQNFSTIDNNLGGTLNLSVAGSSDVVLSSAQSQYLIYNFTGVLTGNINVIFPAAGGLYFINNATTGAFSLTIQAGSSVNGVLIPQGTQAPVYVDASMSPPKVGGATGTQYVFTAVSVSGTANALIIPQTLPSNFSLTSGLLLTFTPNGANTGPVTVTLPDGSTKSLKKIAPAGLIDLLPGDLTPAPVICQYNGSVLIFLNEVYYATPTTVSTNFALDFTGFWQQFIALSNISVTLGPTTAYNPVFYSYFLANGGTVTLIPNGLDKINNVNANFTIQKGSSCRLFNDGAGNWWVFYANAPIDSPIFTGTPSLPTGTTGVTQTLGDNSTKLATTAFVQSALSGKLLNVQKFTSGGTYTPTAGTTQAIIYAIGGGGGGGGGAASNGGNGGTTSVGTLISVNGGTGGGGATASSGGGTAGVGGTVTTATISLPGSAGNPAPTNTGDINPYGGTGGSGFMGAGAGAGTLTTGGAGATNTGAGGGGAGVASGAGINGGGGGGGGGQGITYATGITGTYSVTIGAGGTAGAAGGGNLGGVGGSGLVVIFEYQ